VNADKPRHPEYDAASVAGAASICRFPLWVGDEQQSVEWYNELTAHGVTPMLVLDRRSFSTHAWRYGSYQKELDHWWRLFPFPQYVQAGNEPDQIGDSSSRMTRSRFWRLVKLAAKTWPDSTILAGGLVKVDFSYLDGLPHE